MEEAATAAALSSPTAAAAAAGPSRRPAAPGASSLPFDRRRGFAFGSVKVGKSSWPSVPVKGLCLGGRVLLCWEMERKLVGSYL